MALSRSTRVNILIGNGHFLSHFYVLCLPPMFLAWQERVRCQLRPARHDDHADVRHHGDAADPGRLPGGPPRRAAVPDRRRAADVAVDRGDGPGDGVLADPGAGDAVRAWATRSIHPADYAILSGSVDKDRMGRSFALHTFSGNLGFSAGPPVTAFLMALDRLARRAADVGLARACQWSGRSCCRAAS